MRNEISLERNEVHVWHVDLDHPIHGSAREVLSHDECQRADRFHFERDHRRFSAGRGMLRAVLATYIDTPARNIHFVCNDWGKPSVNTEPNARDLRFNVSHSHNRMVIAIACGREVGVDIEQIRELGSEIQIARQYFSPREYETLTSLTPDLRRVAFFECWTRKEAFIKAIGEGLSIPLDQFDVTLAPGDPPRIERDDTAHRQRRWPRLGGPQAGRVSRLFPAVDRPRAKRSCPTR